MKPTQAQIEAAAKALYGDHSRPPSDRAMAMAKTALTAAAEVGESGMDKLVRRINKLIKDRSEIQAATIERCVRAAKDHLKLLHPDEDANEEAESIAAAIRALKDKT